ncbi:MAG TPA: Asp-tRNA(Asn)/Glu-tRNA(Gln) amidotransferase GatCAB subunit C [Elusimicrobia bacterium]|nr:Asp-tRNA(Asn)/Glu-tRNA(Gln) amidotransferase GatCAB subunit C [Elusimicrobiota bacterium]
MISEAEVLRIAHLARLRLAPNDVGLFQGQLARVLEHVAELDALDLSDVEPTARVQAGGGVLRPDEPVHGACAADILSNAPERDGDFFKVPRVLG